MHLAKMALFDQDGKLFGVVHVIDAGVFFFFLAVVTTVLVYLYAPPTFHEQEEAFFQIYFVSDEYSQPFPYAMAQDTFIPGTELVSPQGSHLTITNVTFTHIFWPSSNVNFIVTLNGTLEKGSDGQYLFNSYQIAPGKMLLLQINHSYFTGTVQRVNFTHTTTTKIITIALNSMPSNITIGDKIYNSFGQEEGFVVSTIYNRSIFILNLTVDVYDDIVLFHENPLYPLQPFSFKTQNEDYSADIIYITKEDLP